jgi:hypothetical protein
VKYEEAEVMKHFTLKTAGGVLVFAGVLAGAAGSALKQTLLLAGGLALIGVGAVLMGLHAIVNGEWKVVRQQQSHSAVVQATYSGLRARLIGLLVALFGVGFTAASLLMLRDGLGSASTAALQNVMHSDAGLSVAIIGLGVFACIWGFVSILGSDEQNRSAGAVLVSLPLRLIAVVFMLAGIAAIWYGLARIFDPQAIDTALAALGLSGK